jgi:NitT/TauT family transport system substrate-binding protein
VAGSKEAKHRRRGARAWAACLLGLALAVPVVPPVQAAAIKIGALRVANVGPVFIAKEKGYFGAEGLETEIISFDEAQPVAAAAAAGTIDFGVTATSAGLYALAGQESLRIIGGLYSERPSFHHLAIVVSDRAYDRGLRRYQDMGGHSVATLALGSPLHYSLALLADQYGVALKSMRLMQRESTAEMLSALLQNEADMAIIAGAAVSPALHAGQVKLLGWVGDETPWQPAVVFAAATTIRDRGNTVQAFLRAFRKGARDYHDAFTGAGEKRQDGPMAAEMLAIIGEYTHQPPDQVRLGIVYVDANARLAVNDILRQIAWFKSQKMVKDDIDATAVMAQDYIIPLPE